MKSKWPKKNCETHIVELTKPIWVVIEMLHQGVQPIYGRKQA